MDSSCGNSSSLTESYGGVKLVWPETSLVRIPTSIVG